MATSTGFALSCRPNLTLRHCLHKITRKAAVMAFNDTDKGKALEWKRFNSKDLGIRTSAITKPTRVVLNSLKKKGFDVYLVGGSVRDLVLKRTPKDFDVITSADLREVKRTFSQCEIVGRRFPICHVCVDDTIVEVSSFHTCAGKSQRDIYSSFEKPADCDEKDHLRWQNCLRRDFTINGLMFDPYAKLVYDYTGGVEDIRKAKVQTIIPASFSLMEDSARILRAVRIAARLGFCFQREMALTIKNLSSSVLRLDRGRLLMEMNYMLAYGSAEASLRLLWRFGLLEILLPIQAAYFVRHGFRRRDKRSNFLLSLFSNLDKLLAPDKPCHNSLWVAILAFHKALSEQARDPSVVAAFCLGVHNGGDLTEASSIAGSISRQHESCFPELLEHQHLDSASLKDEVVDLALSVQRALTAITDEYFVSRAMAEYSKVPYSNVVFVPLTLYLRVGRIFECVRLGKEKGFVGKQGRKINYELLASGSLQEVRHVFARVVFDTIYPLSLGKDQT
ncbi:uncharacterized protein LOC115996301 isoform X2 [Ipomoea triloba]|uniref:uncharacterized protein LOC115996301 isoform X2 n=1 Tax=Ipomoea triloba TaxID=35885 RepID=UPI00125CD876|nr:uncharacterized protein LOC115996301 isoform X2 [Ipomoea triloba]